MKDIEYEKDGARKIAQERFKYELIAVGWAVVGDKPAKKKVKDDNSAKDN